MRKKDADVHDGGVTIGRDSNPRPPWGVPYCADSFSAAEMHSLQRLTACFLQFGAPVDGLDGVIQQPQLPGHVVQFLLQRFYVDRADDADFRAAGAVRRGAGLSGKLPQDPQTQGQRIPAGDHPGQRFPFVEGGAVAQIDGGSQLLQTDPLPELPPPA